MAEKPPRAYVTKPFSSHEMRTRIKTSSARGILFRWLNQPIRLPGLKPGVYPGNTRDLPAKAGAGLPRPGPGKAGAGLPSPGPGKAGAGLPSPGPGKAGAGACSGLIRSGAFYPDLRIGILRRERIKHNPDNSADTNLTMEP